MQFYRVKFSMKNSFNEIFKARKTTFSTETTVKMRLSSFDSKTKIYDYYLMALISSSAVFC